MVNGQNKKIILLLFVLIVAVGMDVYPAEESDTGYKKEYKGNGQYSNEGFELIQGWKLKPINIKNSTLAFDVNLNYKKFNYTIQNNLDFEKAGMSIIATMITKEDLKTFLGLAYANRNQRDETKDKNDYELNSGIEQGLLNNSLELSVTGRYVNRYYKNARDSNLYKIELG